MTNVGPPSARFFDVPYITGYADNILQTSRVNPNYPGKLLFDKRIKLTPQIGTLGSAETHGGNPTLHFKKYFPFNKIFDWAAYPFAEDDVQNIADVGSWLTTAPNWGKYGSPVFGFTYVNGEALLPGGTQKALGWSGQYRIYFKDIDS